MIFGFPCGSAGKESTCNVGDQGLIPRLVRSPGEGTGYPLQYSGLEKSMGHKELDTTEWLSLSLLSWKGQILSRGSWGCLSAGLWPISSPHAGLLGAQSSPVWPQQRNIIFRNDGIRALWAQPPSGWLSPLGSWYPCFLGTLSFRRVLFFFFF